MYPFQLYYPDVVSTWYISDASAATTYDPCDIPVMSLGYITGAPLMYLELPDMSLWYITGAPLMTL